MWMVTLVAMRYCQNLIFLGLVSQLLDSTPAWITWIGLG